MRMWKVHPSVMCRKHLLGEHLELHMFAGTIAKGKKIDGYIKEGLVEVHNIVPRHFILAKEMKKRGYKHDSPLTHKDILTNANLYRNFNSLQKLGRINSHDSYKELMNRCVECRRLING